MGEWTDPAVVAEARRSAWCQGDRLHLDPVERARREAEFGPDASVAVLLHPPILQAIDMWRLEREGKRPVPTTGSPCSRCGAHHDLDAELNQRTEVKYADKDVESAVKHLPLSRLGHTINPPLERPNGKRARLRMYPMDRRWGSPLLNRWPPGECVPERDVRGDRRRRARGPPAEPCPDRGRPRAQS